MQTVSRPARSLRQALALCAGLMIALLFSGWPQFAPVAQAQPPEFNWAAFDPDEEQEGGYCAVPAEGQLPSAQYIKRLQDMQPPEDLPFMSGMACEGGMAGIYPCQNVDLLSFMPLAQIGGGNGNDIWGWTDPLTSKEYAIMGRTNGTAFVDISDPFNPVYMGNLPTHSSNSTWRDIKVYANHAYIVSEASNHGMQVFDLTQLRDVVIMPATFTATAHYNQFGRAHNIAINEETGFAYAVGSVQGTTTCSGGLHMINIQNPTSPTFAGCFSADGYTHDTQCVVYNGPDAAYQGGEVCFNSNENTVTIVDVTNKQSPVMLARQGYAGVGYTHQGWLTEDQRYFLVDDELDESQQGHNTRTYIWDVSNLASPALIGFYQSPASAIDHNQYVVGNHSYQANYRAGLRILNIVNIANAVVTQAGYFDIYPLNDNPNFNGAWSVYPFFESGVVIVSGIEQGLFILRPTFVPELTISKSQPEGVVAPGETITYTITVTNDGEADATGVVVTDTLNGVTTTIPGPSIVPMGTSLDYSFHYTITSDDCSAGLTNLAEVSADGDITAVMDEPIYTPVICQADLEIGKSQPEGTAAPGETITYTITVTNHSPFAAAGLVVTDTLNSAALVIPGPATLASGEAGVYLFAYTVTADDCAGLSNLAEVSGDNGAWAVIPEAIFTPVTCVYNLWLPIIVQEK